MVFLVVFEFDVVWFLKIYGTIASYCCFFYSSLVLTVSLSLSLTVISNVPVSSVFDHFLGFIPSCSGMS